MTSRGGRVTSPGRPVAKTMMALRAHANGRYVCAENAGAASLIANRYAIGPWEQFDLLRS